jgi:hypothetical protein
MLLAVFGENINLVGNRAEIGFDNRRQLHDFITGNDSGIGENEEIARDLGSLNNCLAWAIFARLSNFVVVLLTIWLISKAALLKLIADVGVGGIEEDTT